MIELAPQHKIGLSISSPVMIASGFCGYGDAYQRLIDMSVFGAVVTQPITLRPQRGLPQPRLVEINNGFILNTGQQNPGVKRVLKQFSQVWSRLKAPVIAHLAAAEPNDLMRTARSISGKNILAIELGLPVDTLPEEIFEWVRAVRNGSELPLLLKLPLAHTTELVDISADTGVDALVIGTPPLGAGGTGETASGLIFGPFLYNLILYQLQQLREFPLPIIASGGIHTLSDAQGLLKAGATAIQIDSLLFTNPKRAEEIGRVMTTMASNGDE